MKFNKKRSNILKSNLYNYNLIKFKKNKISFFKTIKVI